MERCRHLIFVLLAVIAAIPVFVTGRRNLKTFQEPAAFSVVSSARGYVRISGDVRHPGMYLWGANKMTIDAILMAAPLQPISMLEPAGIGSVPLGAGAALHVVINSGGRALVTLGTVPASERLVMGMPLDINALSEAELDNVPGIGPVLARNIFQFRQNNGGRMDVQDLLLIDGVGEKKFMSLRKLF
ncbi:MAG: helix-hairpin-helix domain-containing protein [Geobacteraceae bacterium]|nr:helix-hairpin-helix domain-containing protein [Geobacteraceae bacterium]